MKLSEVVPRINPDGDSVVCHDVAPMPLKIGLIFLCDRKPKHTGKHIQHSLNGRMDWWNAMPNRVSEESE